MLGQRDGGSGGDRRVLQVVVGDERDPAGDSTAA
jgi:hypothetical protein